MGSINRLGVLGHVPETQPPTGGYAQAQGACCNAGSAKVEESWWGACSPKGWQPCVMGLEDLEPQSSEPHLVSLFFIPPDAERAHPSRPRLKNSSMTSLLRLGQIVKGSVSSYTLTKQLHDAVWLATNLADERVIVKSVRHWRLQNERDILHQFQARAQSIRPILDEIVDPPDPPAIVLKYVDDDALHASSSRKFSPVEIKHVARRVLEALAVLHEEGFVHTDVKPSNILVNHTNENPGISEAYLADFGSTVPESSEYARDGFPIGTPIFRSPEAALRLKWDRATDIWSFGTTLISLIWGLNWHIFKPDVPVDHEHYELKILMKHCQFFGPYPSSYQDLADEDTQTILAFVMNAVQDVRKPFHLIRESEISKEDKTFVLKIMKLDPRDRPTAKQLLRDEWFAGAASDTVLAVQ